MQKAEAPAAPAEEPGRTARMQELEKARRVAEEMRVFETTNIYFDFDKAELKAEAKATLKEKADWLSENSGYALRIMGHCDERGTAEYNLALGERRAHAAKQFLVALGISAERIYTVSYGEEKPAMTEHNEAAWSKNRRDEFKLIK
jgi:peptidoglycan-associated lipoprotein